MVCWLLQLSWFYYSSSTNYLKTKVLYKVKSSCHFFQLKSAVRWTCNQLCVTGCSLSDQHILSQINPKYTLLIWTNCSESFDSENNFYKSNKISCHIFGSLFLVTKYVNLTTDELNAEILIDWGLMQCHTLLSNVSSSP